MDRAASEPGVAGAVVDVEHLTAGWLSDRGEYADARYRGTEHVFAGGGDVVGGAGFDLGEPQRETVGCITGGLLTQSASGDQFAVEDQVRHAVGFGLAERVVQVRCLPGQYLDDLVEGAVVRARRCFGETSATRTLPGGSTIGDHVESLVAWRSSLASWCIRTSCATTGTTAMASTIRLPGTTAITKST